MDIERDCQSLIPPKSENRAKPILNFPYIHVIRTWDGEIINSQENNDALLKAIETAGLYRQGVIPVFAIDGRNINSRLNPDKLPKDLKDLYSGLPDGSVIISHDLTSIYSDGLIDYERIPLSDILFRTGLAAKSIGSALGIERVSRRLRNNISDHTEGISRRTFIIDIARR